MLSDAQQIFYAWYITHARGINEEDRFVPVLSEAKIDLNPHQVEAALFALHSPLSKGAILADEVGLGKTIEVGLVLAELWARNKRNLLVIVPASLRTQWMCELEEKFDLPSCILDSASYKKLRSKQENPFSTTKHLVICSYHFGVTHSEELSQVHWDLVVMDEAHILRNLFKKENIFGKTLKSALKPFKKVLLTATPFQNNLKELYSLISLIDDDLSSSVHTFEEHYTKINLRDQACLGELRARLSPIIHRTLRSQVQEYIRFTKRIPMVQEFDLSEPEKCLYEKVDHYLFRENNFGIPERCRSFIRVLLYKILSSSIYAFTFTLQGLCKRLQQLKEEGSSQVLFSTLVREIETYRDKEAIDTPLFTEVDDSPIHIDNNQQIEDEINEIQDCLKQAQAIKTESKTIELIKALRTAFQDIERLGAPKKALVFTESRRTQLYVKKILEKNGFAGQVVLFNGTNNDAASTRIYKQWKAANPDRQPINGSIGKRQALVDYFKNEGTIMIATEAGSEGLNLQCCSLVINYDLPWNPQRIEQRIGRCHRYGQLHDVIVVNFLNRSNLIDRHIYQLLTQKFNLFSGVFGSSDEMIGTIESTINIENRLNTIYNTCRTEEDINKAFQALTDELQHIIQAKKQNAQTLLLENFNRNIVAKFGTIKEELKKQISTQKLFFWQLALNTLQNSICQMDHQSFSFYLKNNLSPQLPQGYYTFDKRNQSASFIKKDSYLGKYILNGVPKKQVRVEFATFKVPANHTTNLLQSHINEQGWIIGYEVTAANHYDTQHDLLLYPLTQEGKPLPEEFGYEIFKLQPKTISTSAPTHMAPLPALTNVTEVLSLYQAKLEQNSLKYIDQAITQRRYYLEDGITSLQNKIIELRKAQKEITKEMHQSASIAIKLAMKEKADSLTNKIDQSLRLLKARQIENQHELHQLREQLTFSFKYQLEYKQRFLLHWEFESQS